MLNRTMRYGLAATVATAMLAASAAMAAETTIRAVAPWNKNHPLTKSFLRFVDKTNKEGKGIVSIKFLGGPEVTKAREQPKAMRNGLFDMIYGPPGYYLGIFPEGDFTHGFKTPTQARNNGGYEMIRQAMKEKMNARFIARFDSGLGLYLFLKNPPKRTASGNIDLSGLKMRSSPAYRNFIQDLGGTAIVMRPTQVYTALERGVVDGMGFTLVDVRARQLHKFIKYVIDPPFSYAGTAVIMDHKLWDKMPAKSREFIDKMAEEHEVSSRKYWIDRTNTETAEIKKLGVSFVTLSGKAREEYVEMFMKGPWGRMARNPKVKLDVQKLKSLVY